MHRVSVEFLRFEMFHVCHKKDFNVPIPILILSFKLFSEYTVFTSVRIKTIIMITVI